MDTISPLAHCQPHAGTPIPGIPSQAVRTLAKGRGRGSLKKKTWSDTKNGFPYTKTQQDGYVPSIEFGKSALHPTLHIGGSR